MPSSNPDSGIFCAEERDLMLKLARDSIQQGVETGEPVSVRPDDAPPALQKDAACFVTLNRNQQLRGCIGHLEAIQPLIKDVADNAFAAAFRDPRFPPLRADELDRLEIHISILTPATAMAFDSELDLLSQIEPGVDGLILEDGMNRGTFLPSVWESLPTPKEFLTHLKRKAGLSVTYWSDTIRVSRYRTESFTEIGDTTSSH
ncbi:MAG: AmmeMemoRadiSam system protein A [Gammaproteobacteria bacterium]|nr:AmmeMemoRadiSam system protein A [Gammaproteobacteria bacterium]